MNESEMLDALIADLMAKQGQSQPGRSQGPQRNSDGTYGTPPEGMIANPYTGQMTDRNMLKSNMNDTTRGGAFARGGRQGVYFNYADEAQGAIDGMRGGPGTFQERYEFGRERARAGDELAQEQHGGSYTAGQIGGGVVAAGATAPLAYGATTLGSAAKIGAGLGAVEGFAHGTGRGEGASDRISKGITDATVGAGVGIAAPYAMEGGRQVFNTLVRNPVSGVARTVTGTPSQRRVAEVIDDTFRRAGKTPQQVQSEVFSAQRAGQPEFRSMDALGMPAQDRVRGIARAGGEGADELRDFLAERQISQRDRVAGFVDDALMPPNRATARQLQGDLFDARKAEADVLYEQARNISGPVNLTPTISTVDDLLNRNPLLGETALARSDIGKKLLNLRAQLQNGGEQLIDFQRVLDVKSDMFRQMEVMKRSGVGVPREFSAVYAQLDQALEGASDGYRVANDSFRQASARIDAVDAGRTFAGQRPEDAIDQFRALPADAQDGARAGYGDTILRTIQNRDGEAGNIAKKVTGSIKNRELMGELASNPNLLRSRINRENQMFSNFDAALGNSSTAQNTQAIADMAGETSVPALEVGRELLNFQAGNALARAAQSIAPMMTGQSPATRQEIARLLMAKDPVAAMAPILARKNTTDATRRIVEAMMRITSGREGGEAIAPTTR